MLTGSLQDLSARPLASPRRTEVEKGPILWVDAYLRSESARNAPMEKAMLRPGVEPEADEKRCW